MSQAPTATLERQLVVAMMATRLRGVINDLESDVADALREQHPNVEAHEAFWRMVEEAITSLHERSLDSFKRLRP